MASSSCFICPQIFPKIDGYTLVRTTLGKGGYDAKLNLYIHGLGTEVHGLQERKLRAEQRHDWSFLGGHKLKIKPKVDRFILSSKSSGVCYSWLTNSQIATSVFSLGTVAVLPFYTLMVVAPRAELTKKTMKSSIPYVVLGLLYTYLLYLSWNPDTIRLMFASKYWLPELPGIAKMFSNEMTLASAWIHLLVVDLFAARQVYQDGLENEVETRHSVSLCLLFCPVGVVSHVMTKMLSTGNAEKTTESR